MVKIKSCFGLGCEAIKNPRKFNGVLGVSVGSRGFSKKDLIDYINFCDKNFSKILILIVDSIKKYNFMAFQNLSEKEALKKAMFEGKEFEVAVKRVLKTKEYQGEETNKFTIKHWDEIKSDISCYNEALEILQKYYKKDKIFHSDCLKMTDKYIQSRQFVNFSDNQKEVAVNFLLEELSLFLTIGNYVKNNYVIDIYPDKFPVIENILSNKYPSLLEELPKPILYGHIELTK